MPVRAADPARLAAGLVGQRACEAVHNARAGPGDGDGLQQLGGHRREDQALGAAGRPQPKLLHQHHEPLRVDILLRLSGIALLSALGQPICTCRVSQKAARLRGLPLVVECKSHNIGKAFLRGSVHGMAKQSDQVCLNPASDFPYPWGMSSRNLGPTRIPSPVI